MKYAKSSRVDYTARRHAEAMSALKEAQLHTSRGNERERRDALKRAADNARDWADSIESAIPEYPQGWVHQ